MKKAYKIIAVFVLTLVMAISLAGCAQSFSKDDIEAGLKRNGYTVSVYTAAEFEETGSNGALQTTKMNGLQTVIYAEKKNSSNQVEYMCIILVYDSIGSAENISNADRGLLYGFAENYISTVKYGQYNNVVFSGSNEARLAAGILGIDD